jgi:hypothetical protein
VATTYDLQRLLDHVKAALTQEGVVARPANPKWERTALDLAASVLDALGVEPHPQPPRQPRDDLACEHAEDEDMATRSASEASGGQRDGVRGC